MSHPVSRSPLTVWLLLPGVTMSVGWGLRGFIGGGPLGAMIPGALVALALCCLLGIGGGHAAKVAAFGALGVGFGGQETYGQTVQFISRPEMLTVGLAGLAVKGAVWGVVGGACLGVGLAYKREHRTAVWWSLGLLVGGTLLGWYFIDDPKLLYFSNRLDRPRPELWAGLLTGGLFLLAGLGRAGLAALPVRFALAGGVGGGIGFPLGGILMLTGRLLPLAKDSYPGWKLMEFTFGLCFGVALGLAACLNRARLAGEPATEPAVDAAKPWHAIGLGLLAIVVVVLGIQLPLRFNFTVVGALLLAAVLTSDRLAWQVALTVTIAAFARDVTGFYREQQPGTAGLGWIMLVGITLASAWWLERGRAPEAAGPRRALLFLLGMALAAAYGRTLLYTTITVAQVIVAIVFTLLAALVVRLTRPAPHPASLPLK